MEIFFYFICSCVLIYGGITDFKYREIPNMVPIVIMISGIFTGSALISRILFLIIFAFSMIFAAKLAKAELPGGDFKLLCALFFTYGLVTTIEILFFTGIFIVAISLIKKASLRRNIPLCCYIAPAYILTGFLKYFV